MNSLINIKADVVKIGLSAVFISYLVFTNKSFALAPNVGNDPCPGMEFDWGAHGSNSGAPKPFLFQGTPACQGTITCKKQSADGTYFTWVVICAPKPPGCTLDGKGTPPPPGANKICECPKNPIDCLGDSTFG